MQESAGSPEQKILSPDAEPTQSAGNQVVLGISIGALAFVCVMVLMVLAVMRVPSSSVVSDSGHRAGDVPNPEYAPQIVVENAVSRVGINTLGDRELQICGYVRNAGRSTVTSADVKCYFGTVSQGEILLEFPLVVGSRLDEVGSGKLPPKSGREFGVRFVGLREGLGLRLSRLEVVDVNLETL